MKILMLTTNSSLMDGINRHILNISVALNSHPDVKVAVCTIFPEGELNTALRNKGVKEYALGFPNGHVLGIYKAFGKVVNQFCPDIIHLHVLALMERIYLSLNGGKYKLIETIHGISDEKTPSVRDHVEKCLQKVFPINIEGRCYISEGIKEYYSNSLPVVKMSQICYNPISFPTHIQVSRHKLHDIIGVSVNDIIIGTICRIAAVKNPVVFTTVMCDVLAHITNAHAVVIGDGDNNLVNSCKAIVNQHNLDNRFHWLGYRSDAPELARDLDCFIMTSITEGMPTSVLECFVSKTPVAILEGKGGIRDILRLNTSERPIIVTATKENLKEFSMKIAQLLIHREEAKVMSENAYLVGKETFGMERVIDKLMDMYSKLLKA